MKSHLKIVSVTFLLSTFVSSIAVADDLSDAYKKAQDFFRDEKPSSSNDSDRSRDAREEQRIRQADVSKKIDPEVKQREEEKQRAAREHEVEKLRISKNFEIIDSNLAHAGGKTRATPATMNTSASAAIISAREAELNALMNSRDVLAALRLSSLAKEEARRNANVVHNAIALGGKPPFKPLWDYYKYNRPIALGLVPVENKCAIVMSMTLGLVPQNGETSLQDIGNKELVAVLEGPIKGMMVTPVKDSDIATRYYLRAQQLANRLERDWGAPVYLEGKKARAAIAGKKGIIFLENAYGYSGDHIDLWDSDHIAGNSTTPFHRADKVWFWEIP